MTQLKKLIAKLMGGSPITHEESRVILEAFGYKMRQGMGSGVKFVKEGCAPIVYHVPHGGAKELPHYVLDKIQETVKKGL